MFRRFANTLESYFYWFKSSLSCKKRIMNLVNPFINELFVVMQHCPRTNIDAGEHRWFGYQMNQEMYADWVEVEYP